MVPSLERRLVDARLDQLEKLAVPLARSLPEDTLSWQNRVEYFAVVTNARVVALNVLSTSKPAFASVADSRRGRSSDAAKTPSPSMPWPTEKSSARVSSMRTVTTQTSRYRATPTPSCCFRRPWPTPLATVRLVEQRLLLATVFALLLALVLGLTAAGMLANRLLRLETAAERIAGGDFGAPIVDRGNDEIGELADAFDRMRVQLAQLDNARKGSSRTRRMSFEHRCSRSVDSSSCLLTRTSTTRRNGFIDTMQGQVQRLTKLSADLLDLSRVDAGQLRVLREPVDLTDVVQLLAGDLAHLATSTGHLLETDAEAGVWASGDVGRVLQIGRALVTNALVHTPAGTRVVIRSRRSGERAELSVEDDGPGVPAQHEQAVFGRFYRVDGGMASGSGLGLAIAREIARLMGGSVRLDSGGDPTVFTLDLPAELAAPCTVFT